MILLRKLLLSLLVLTLFSISAINAETVRSASEYDYPPLALVIDGKAGGFSVDLLKATLKEENIDVSFYVGSWSQIKKDLEVGKIDVLPLVGRTPERELLYDFTVPYLTLYGAVFVKEGRTDIKTLEDLRDKSIVVMKGDNAEEFVRRKKLSKIIHTTETFEEAFQLVSKGKYDAVVTQKLMGSELLKRTGINNVLPVTKIKEFKQDFTFAVTKGNSELLSKLNEGLSKIITNGTYKTVYNKWLGKTYKKKIDSKEKAGNVSRNQTIWLLAFLFLALIVFLILSKLGKVKFEKDTILLLLAGALILIIATFIFNGFHTTKNLRENAVRNYFDTLNAIASTLNTNIKNEVSHNIDFIKLISLQETITNEDLNAISQNNVDITNIFILDANGKTILSSDLSEIGIDRSVNSYFSNTKKEGYVKPVYLSKTEGRVIFSLSTPYKDGVLVARININHTQKIVSNIEGLGESGEALLAYRNENGDAVFFTERKFRTDLQSKDIIPKENVNIPITQALLGNQSKFSDFMDYRNVPVFAVTKYIKEIDAGLVVKIDQKEALKSVSESINEIWYSTIGTIFAIIIIFILFYFLLTKALRREIENKTAEHKKYSAEKRKLEEKLLQSQKMEAIGTLAGGIAHDFNNILSPIIGYTELLLSEMKENNSSRKRLNIVLNAAMRAKNLVQQILAFSRQNKTDKKPTAIQPAIKEVLTLLESVLPSTIEIVQNVDDKCGMVMADYTQLHQILMNLCTNAFQAMEKTGGKLKIDLEETDTGYALLTICDTGKGIEEDALKRIFEPYFTTKDMEKGTGLGLSVVHGIVKEYGGEITVYSELGKGTIFKVYIPLIESCEVENSTPQILSEKSAGKKILLVDDEEIIISVVSEILEQSGHYVTSFQSSSQALKKFQEDPSYFDLIVTDKTMPELTGLQLATEVQKTRKDIPIILCSGFIDFDLQEAAEKTGIVAVLQKPISMKVLTETVSNALNRAS